MVIQHTTPAIVSKDVLYIGSAVPLETSEGLEAVQQPLRSRYPLDNDENVQGVLSVLSIIPSGIQLRFKNDPSVVVLFPFSALTMCAAVRCVKTINQATNEVSARFVSLSSPEAGGANSQRPAIFTAITRRTKGRQVLECHGFITMTPKDALELVHWTSTLDKRSKHGEADTLGAAASSSAYDVSRGDTSFYAESTSLTDFPVQLVPGEPVIANTSPAFYNEPSPSGYFYSTKQTQVKKYALHKFGGSTGVEDTPSLIPAGADHFQRRPGYASSHHSASAAVFPTQPRYPFMVPVRTYMPPRPPPPTFIRPVLVRPPPPPPMYVYPRPRFFSPPPAMRVRPVPVFVPPPVSTIYNEGSHIRTRAGRHGSKGSSRSSSASSQPESPRLNGRSHRKAHPHIHDESSESNSRPRTPPTDYDNPRGPRMSRREDFYLRHNVTRDHSGFPRAIADKGYYVVPPYGYYSLPPGAGLGRPRSVPPYAERTVKKAKNKKAKKNKKGRKKVHKKDSYDEPHDESTDSVGYMSELSPNVDSRQPRDFRRMENQFKHERAFSKSLAEETRHPVKGSGAFNAYSLNNTPGTDEFPPTMY